MHPLFLGFFWEPFVSEEFFQIIWKRHIDCLRQTSQFVARYRTVDVSDKYLREQ